jgi:hypothetical protein
LDGINDGEYRDDEDIDELAIGDVEEMIEALGLAPGYWIGYGASTAPPGSK